MAEIGFFNRVPRNEDNVIARRYVGYKGTKGFPEPALDALGLTEQEIAGDKRLCAAYLTARRQEAA